MSELELPASERRLCPLMSRIVPLPTPMGTLELQPCKMDCARSGCALWDEDAGQCGLKETRKCPKTD